MSFAEWSNNKHKKKKKDGQTFAEWSNEKYGVDDIAPIRTTTTLTGDDIAPPVKTGLSFKDAIGIANEYKKKNSVFGTDFFKKPESFDDKEKAKSVGKAILGTGADFSLNVLTGVGNFVEGIGDTINYGIADISEKAGNKDFADALREETKKSVVQYLLGETTETVDKWSVLDKTSDSVAQGLGMITTLGAGGMALGNAGLGVAGQTAVTTGGTLFSGVGSGMSEAYQDKNTTDEEARTYGLISGAAEALSELIFGGLGKGLKAVGLGKGLSSADDMLAKKVSNMFSSQITKNLAEYGIKAGAEGFEEVLAGIAQAIGKKMTYMSEKDFLEILKEENLLEQFIVGSVTSGFAQVGDFINSSKTKTDFISGLTENEQKVVDKEVENRIAEREEKGEKVTNKDKSKIYDEVVKALDKGYISIDTIESALGGETYDNYKSVTEQEDSLQNEFNTLNKMKQGEMTGEQSDRKAELKQQLEELKKNSKRTQIKEQLSNEVFGLAKGSRLAESYNENARRGKSFEADLSKYDTKQQEVIKKAVESGILNNTNRTHEFVDMIAKISADKGVLFDFTNNEKLKNSGFALKGKTVNGYKTEDGNIALNIQSQKALDSVVGHEITHILEGTELYDTLQEAVKQYATTKGEYVERMQSLRELYTGVYKGTDFDTKLREELTADIVGDYLFTDADFINNLSTEQPNLFKKIYNEIKYLCKVATAGSKEERELEKVKKAFDKAYKDTTKNTTDESDVKYSLSENHKEKQLDIINKYHPKADWDYQTWITSVDDIKTYAETVEDESNYATTPDFTDKDVAEALKTGKVKVYSSHDIRYGTFVTPSYMEAKNYAGQGKINSMVVNLEDVAWIDSLQGQYAPVEADTKHSLTDSEGRPIDAERISSNELDTKYSLSKNPEIAKGQSEYLENHKMYITKEELAEAQKITNAMVDVMMKYSSILPEDKIGKVLTKNGSYDRSVENTTICVRTLAYNEFVDKVQEEIGRPLTQMESFLVSQKLYDIATEPQCLYCYVSLDRKAFNDMLLRYMQERDTVIDKYKSGKWEDLNTYTEEQIKKMTDEQKAGSLYCDFLRGRKSTKNTIKRFNDWLNYVDSGTQLLSLADIATEARQSEIAKAQDSVLKEQLKDARAYAQSASWSKIQKNYVAYRDEILRLGDRVVKNLNEHYGLRWYSFSDYSAAFIVENMQQITDASIRGLKGLSYTKDTDYAEIFAPSGMNINISVFVNTDANGNFFIDEKQSANFEKALELREKYPNVGIVATVTNDEALRWAGEQEWSDVIIPFHIVRTGTDVAEYYKWLNYTSESADTIADADMWSAYLDSLNLKSENARKKVSKNIYPNEHKNDKATYLALCESRGLSPRFVRFAGEEWYMKLVNETRLSADESSPLKPSYNLEAAQTSFQKFVEKGGYEGGWYKDGVDVDAEVKVVADDVIAGKKANEVDYGRQDGFVPENLIAGRKTNRGHNKASLSKEGEQPNENGRFYGKDMMLDLPIREDIAKNATTTFDDIAPMTEAEAKAMRNDIPLTDADVPPEFDVPMYDETESARIDDTTIKGIGQRLRETLSLTAKETKAVEEVVQKYSTTGLPDKTKIFDDIKEQFGEKVWRERNEEIAEVKRTLKGFKIKVSDKIKSDIPDYSDWKKRHQGRLNFSKDGLTVDDIYMGLSISYPGLFPDEIINPTDQLLRMAELADNDIYISASQEIDNDTIQQATDIIYDEVNKYKENELTQHLAEEQSHFYKSLAEETTDNQHIQTVKERLNAKLENVRKELLMNQQLRDDSISDFEQEITRLQAVYDGKRDKNTKVANDILRRIERLQTLKGNVEADYSKRISDLKEKRERLTKEMLTGESPTEQGAMRRELHESIIKNIKNRFEEKGFRFDDVFRYAKNLSTFSTVDNTPQRVMEKALGYKQGQILADETVNKVAQNESEGIKWLNSFTDKKNGLLAQLSKEYHIKPGSKESAAAQMYAERFYVDENNDIVKYWDEELEIDFPDETVRQNIKGLANDPRIRQIYDETLDAINESRIRNAYPEIKKLDNYFLHFRAMQDTFSRLGLPFNPNDIKAKDLPTDLNGVTADLKPGQPYFASAKHRMGKRTSFDLLGGLEKYLSSAKNQIYHIDDIQTLRALRNYIADTYGQAHGFDDIDSLTEEEVQERLKEVYNSHLSTFAKFLNEEANVIAGKTALIDRGIEGIIGRRGIQLLDTVNKQVGSNMVGFNISSSLTNFLSVAQSLAKNSKRDSLTAFTQMASNKISTLFGKSDGFAESNPGIVRRKGAEKFAGTPYEKVKDAGYLLASAVDNISTEFIIRTKFNEFTRKGMSEEQAHVEADKWASRLLGDRSLGQQPQLYNSKTLGLFTKFQLEVRNQLDTQFYDTIQEAKVSNEEIENALARNAKTAAKVGSTFLQLAILQHAFGKAFESVAGYNPAFDIIDVLIKTFGFDDDEEDEDTPLDNLEQGFLALLEDLPYTSTLTGGRIPISSALPIKELVTGEDDYGTEKSRVETLKETIPYYLLPGGYGQIKKTAQGLKMFDDDLPIAGSYTDSGNLRFPVEDTPLNRVQAAVFGQYANKNARKYFDDDIAPLNEKQIKEYADLDLPIADYWKYRERLKDFEKQDEKVAYINGLDVTEEQKNTLKSYLYDEEGYKEDNPEKYAFLESEGIGFLGYKEADEETQEAWSWAFKHQDEYRYFKENGVDPEDYSAYYVPMLEFEDEGDRAYEWAFKNPEKATIGKVFGEGVKEYRQYTSDLDKLEADKDSKGNSISGSLKKKKSAYINSLDIEYGTKCILYKSQYPKDNSYNKVIVDYLIGRDDITYEEKKTILEELGATVDSNGYIRW